MTIRTQETAPENLVREHQSGTVGGSEGLVANDSTATIPRETRVPVVDAADSPGIVGTRPWRARAALLTDGAGQVIKDRAVQIVHEFGAPESHGAIQCASWCTDGAGHRDSIMRSDQVCWAPSNAVVLGLAEGAPALPIALVDWAQLDPPHLAVAARRDWHGVPVVDLHLYHPHENANVSVDFNTQLTAAEAIQLARFLLDAAATIGEVLNLSTSGGVDDGR